jgi:hypothetical protein
MRDLKTTLTGLIGGLAMIAAAWGFDVSTEFQTSLAAVILTVMGWLAKDK